MGGHAIAHGAEAGEEESGVGVGHGDTCGGLGVGHEDTCGGIGVGVRHEDTGFFLGGVICKQRNRNE